MVSRVRDAAGLFIECGRALGAAAQVVSFEGTLTRLYAADRSELESAVGAALHDLQQQRRVLDEYAAAARVQAEALLAEIEHPGAVLARRFVATWRGARAAWRGSR